MNLRGKTEGSILVLPVGRVFADSFIGVSPSRLMPHVFAARILCEAGGSTLGFLGAPASRRHGAPKSSDCCIWDICTGFTETAVPFVAYAAGTAALRA